MFKSLPSYILNCMWGGKVNWVIEYIWTDQCWMKNSVTIFFKVSSFKESLTLHSEVFALELLSILCHLRLKLIADRCVLWQLNWCWDQQHSPGDRSKALLSLQTFLNSLEAAKSRSWEACSDKSSVRRECPFLLAAVLPGGMMFSFPCYCLWQRDLQPLHWLWEIVQLLSPSDARNRKMGNVSHLRVLLLVFSFLLGRLIWLVLGGASYTLVMWGTFLQI